MSCVIFYVNYRINMSDTIDFYVLFLFHNTTGNVSTWLKVEPFVETRRQGQGLTSLACIPQYYQLNLLKSHSLNYPLPQSQCDDETAA